jgi:O-antigen/teichoic acid export membrane protein
MWKPKHTPEWSQLLLLAATAIRMVTSLGLTMMAGRMLAPGEFGGFALVATAFGLAHEFTDMGSGNVAVRQAARARDTERTVLENLLGLRLVLCIVAALACAAFALVRTEGFLRGMLLGTATVLAFSYVSAFSTVFQLRQAQMRPAILSVVAQLASVAIAAAMLLLSVDGGLLGGVIILREVAVVVGTTLLAVNLLGYTPRPRISREALRPFFGVALVVALGTVAYHFQLQGGLFWVQVMRPEPETGAFAAAQRPLNAILFLPWLVMLPMVPLLSLAAGHDRVVPEAEPRQDGPGDRPRRRHGRGHLELAEPLPRSVWRASPGPLPPWASLHWFAGRLAPPCGGRPVHDTAADHRNGHCSA